ncbi:MAG: DNA topoisomerase family protein, partial [Desulfotomaculales bacterium]
AETGARCPKCGRTLVMRRTKRGRKFYGCTGYPACDFVTWDRPVAEPCPRCGGLMVEKGPRRVCSDRECGYREGPGWETGEGRG